MILRLEVENFKKDFSEISKLRIKLNLYLNQRNYYIRERTAQRRKQTKEKRNEVKRWKKGRGIAARGVRLRSSRLV